VFIVTSDARLLPAAYASANYWCPVGAGVEDCSEIVEKVRHNFSGAVQNSALCQGLERYSSQSQDTTCTQRTSLESLHLPLPQLAKNHTASNYFSSDQVPHVHAESA